LVVTHVAFRDLGLIAYDEALALQRELLESVLASRDATPTLGAVLLLEHNPVITVSRRPSAATNVLATPELLARHGVTLAETDRGGDVTYHGPGQLIAYPILDLNALNLGLHAYMRLLEEAVIRTCASFGLATTRDPSATGVWTLNAAGQPLAKIAAMGVRVRKWVSMHGLSLNIEPDLTHFGLIVPCGLVGRPVTSLRRELGPACPAMPEVKSTLTSHLTELIRHAAAQAQAGRDAGAVQK
jgi:lipoyl(octanoyl) transferase